jgi:3',5'-cyclic AMP phosphodiesterase CpdA
MNILHLSDVHFGSHHGFKNVSGDYSLANGVAIALEEGVPALQVDHLILSGDQFSNTPDADLGQAIAGIKALQETLGLDASRSWLLPGNHDVQWLTGNKVSFDSYNALVEACASPQCRTENLPCVVRLESRTQPDSTPVALILLDSNLVESEKAAGIGSLGDRRLQLESLLRAQDVSGKREWVLAVTHHHLLPVNQVMDDVLAPDEPRTLGKTPSVTLDALQALHDLGALGVSAVLHGHQHTPALQSFRDELSRRQASQMYVVSAGSAGAKWTNRHFFLYQVDDRELLVRSFWQNPANEYRFISQDVDKRIPRAQPARSQPLHRLGHCPETKVAEKLTISPNMAKPGDETDLCYLFLTSHNLLEARQAIREMIRNSNPESYSASYVKISGLYEAMGAWDLAIRLRIGGRTYEGKPQRPNLAEFRNQMEASLLKRGIIDRPRQEAPSGCSVPFITFNRKAPEFRLEAAARSFLRRNCTMKAHASEPSS